MFLCTENYSAGNSGGAHLVRKQRPSARVCVRVCVCVFENEDLLPKCVCVLTFLLHGKNMPFFGPQEETV